MAGPERHFGYATTGFVEVEKNVCVHNLILLKLSVSPSSKLHNKYYTLHLI